MTTVDAVMASAGMPRAEPSEPVILVLEVVVISPGAVVTDTVTVVIGTAMSKALGG